MVDTIELVEKKLRESLPGDESLADVLSLWTRVREWNAQGGKPAIEAGLKELAKGIQGKADEDLAKLNEILRGAD